MSTNSTTQVEGTETTPALTGSSSGSSSMVVETSTIANHTTSHIATENTPTLTPADTSTSTTTTPTDTTTTTSTSSTTTTTDDTTSTTSTTDTSTTTSTTNTTISTPTTTSTTTTPSLSPTPTTLSSSSTSTFQSTSLLTSGGVTITKVIQVTSVIPPGSVITAPARQEDNASNKNSNTGPIVGGVVGGIAGLALVAVLIWFLLRRRRNKDEFDGNFDPASIGKGGPTLPQMGAVDEDDGVGGRLATGADGGGIISPYSYNPASLPVVGAAGAAAGGAAYLNHNTSHTGHSQSQYGTSSASYYPATSPSSEGHPPLSPMGTVFSSENGYGSGAGADGLNGRAMSMSSSAGGYYPSNVNPYAPMIGRGPSPGPSVNAPLGTGTTTGSSEHSSAGYGNTAGAMGLAAAGAGLGAAAGAGVNHRPRSAKELEAMGIRPNQPHVVNPDEQRHQAYLQYGPGGYSQAQQQQQNIGGQQGEAVPDNLRPGMSSTPSHAGSGVVVHQDGGRVVMGKGRAGEDDEEQLPEIPPTYDSLLPDREERR